tara:strand:+ start:689 stop:1534 length:846 start_codon:yes stop_codon:yes gene_type:complete
MLLAKLGGDSIKSSPISINFPSKNTGRKPALEVTDLTVIRSGKVILEEISLEINTGEFVGIVGPNGSGKSTLALSVLGFLKAQNGTIRILDQKPLSKNLNGKIGWVPQAASNLPTDLKITVEELVMLGTVNSKNMFFWPNAERKSRVKTAIEKVGLETESKTDVSKLSGGQRQRAVIAKALASNAEFIVLDEPLVGIDKETRNSLLKLLDNLCHDEGKTILMISHDITAMRQTAHRIIYLEDGIRYDGPSSSFPEFSLLAAIRGIVQVHDVQEEIQPKEEE